VPGIFLPAHVLGRGTGPHGIGRFAAGVGGKPAAPFIHDTQAAEAEHFDIHLRVFDNRGHLGQGQHPGQHRPLNAEFPLAEIHRLVIGGRALDGKVQAQVRMPVPGIGQKAHVRHDHRIHPQVRRPIHRLAPGVHPARLGIGVDGQEHLAPPGLGVANALVEGFVVKIQPGEIAGIGVVFKAQIDGVGAVIHRGFQGRQAARRADQLGQGGLGHDDSRALWEEGSIGRPRLKPLILVKPRPNRFFSPPQPMDTRPRHSRERLAPSGPGRPQAPGSTAPGHQPSRVRRALTVM